MATSSFSFIESVRRQDSKKSYAGATKSIALHIIEANDELKIVNPGELHEAPPNGHKKISLCPKRNRVQTI